MNMERQNHSEDTTRVSLLGTFVFVLFNLFFVAVVTALLMWRFWYQPARAKSAQQASAQPLPAASLPAVLAPASNPAPVACAASATQPAAAVTSTGASMRSLVYDGRFAKGFAHWGYWLPTNGDSNHIRLVELEGLRTTGMAVRIENPDGAMIGIRQAVDVQSGSVYRLGAVARSLSGRTTNVLFGGRLAFFIPGQAEHDIVWMTEYNSWWGRSVVFTNYVAGSATIYVHLGYGRVATTGEFTDIRLEQVGSVRSE